MSIVDAEGNEIMRDTESTLTGGVIDNPDIEIPRDDLVGLLYAAPMASFSVRRAWRRARRGWW